MHESIRWGIGVLFTLVMGGYAYTYTSGNALEDRITRQLDIIERKVDLVIERQFNQRR